MVLSRQDAINDALARLSDIGFTWGPNFAEHGPMAAEAITMLGHNDAVSGWVETYKAKRRHIAPPPRYEPIDGSEACCRTALGDPVRLSDWLNYFRRELMDKSCRDVLCEWLPRLVDGHAGALTHGLIRTGHAVRGLPVDGDPTLLQQDKLARGLAYWAGTYRTCTGGTEPRLPAVMSGVPADGANTALSQHTAALARVLLIHIDGPIVPVIQLVHTITSASALRSLLPLFPSDFGKDAYGYARRVSAEILASVEAAPDSSGTEPESRLPWDDLAERAVAHGDEHVSKLTEACLQEDFIRPDPVYRVLAEAIQRRLPAWA